MKGDLLYIGTEKDGNKVYLNLRSGYLERHINGKIEYIDYERGIIL